MNTGITHPERCVANPAIPCHQFGKNYLWFDAEKCKAKPCNPAIEGTKSGIMIISTGGNKRPYADTLSHYKAVTDKPENEVSIYLLDHFRVGPEWYANKLEQFRRLPDGTGFTFTIRDPYKD